MSQNTLAVLLIVAGAGCALLASDATCAGEPAPTAPKILGVKGSQSQNFPARTFAHLADRTQGAVAISRRSSRLVIGTGVLLAPDLVLTCRHLTHHGGGTGARTSPGSLDVCLEVRATQGPPTYRRFPVREYAYTSDRLDMCVLAINPDTEGALPDADRVQTLSKHRVRLHAPILVFHHPRGQRLQIAVGGRVLFPFEATEAEVAALTSRARRDAVSAAEGGRLAGEIQRSYYRVADGLHRNFSRRWAGQPVIGADCLTSDGSSGAPVYDRRTLDLVGIVFAGVDQSLSRIPSRWEHHEAILPAVAILEELARCPEPRLRRLAAPTPTIEAP